MQRIVVMFLAGLLATGASWGQEKPMVPVKAVSEHGKLHGKSRVFYLLRQLDLTAEQREHARGLIATILETDTSPSLSLEQVYTLMAEAQEAEKQGDQERAKQISQELRELGRGMGADSEFFMNMEPVLTDEQKEALRVARARLGRNPSGAVRPVDVFRTLDRLNLSKDQRPKLNNLRRDFRRTMRTVQSLKDKDRFQLMNSLLDSIKTRLTPEQRKEFTFRIRQLRPDLAYNLRIRPPATQPAEEDESAGTPGPDSPPGD